MSRETRGIPVAQEGFLSERRDAGFRRNVVEQQTETTINNERSVTQETIQFEYDDKGRVVTEIKRLVASPGLDKKAQREAERKLGQQPEDVLKYVYDEAGRILEKVWTKQENPERKFLSREDEAFRLKEAFAYDKQGRVVRQSWMWRRKPHGLRLEPHENGWTRDFEYEGENTIPLLELSGGSQGGTWIEREFDATGRPVKEILTTEEWGKRTQTQTSLRYDAKGLLVEKIVTYDEANIRANLKQDEWHVYSYKKGIIEEKIGHVGDEKPYGVKTTVQSSDGRSTGESWVFGEHLMWRWKKVADAQGNPVEWKYESFARKEPEIEVKKTRYTYR